MLIEFTIGASVQTLIQVGCPRVQRPGTLPPSDVVESRWPFLCNFTTSQKPLLKPIPVPPGFVTTRRRGALPRATRTSNRSQIAPNISMGLALRCFRSASNRSSQGGRAGPPCLPLPLSPRHSSASSSSRSLSPSSRPPSPAGPTRPVLDPSLYRVERREADGERHGALDPVHRHALVEST